MRIAELSRRTGASRRSLRYYESLGLLVAARTRTGYRDFDEAAVLHVGRIKLFLGLGYGLEEVRAVLSPVEPRDMRAVCADVIAVHRRKLVELDAHIRGLQELRERVAERVDVLERQRAEGGPPAR